MPLTARTTSGERVSILDFENADELYRQYPRDTLISPFPDVDVPVHARFCTQRVNHFAHRSAYSTRYGVHPYSLDHEAAKLTMGQFISSRFKMYVQYEVPIGNRIVDVLGTSASGHSLVIECQFSPITADELVSRSQDILSHGIEISWVFGPKAQNQSVIAVHESLLGAAYFISTQTNAQDCGTQDMAAIAKQFRHANNLARRNIFDLQH